MYLSTRNLATFGDTEIVQERTALRFDHEVQPLALVGIDQDSPVRVVASQGRRHREPARPAWRTP